MNKKKTKAKKGQYAAYGLLIRTARKAKGLTQDDMGRRLNITRQGYAHYELGGALPTAAELPKLCEVLGIDAGIFGSAGIHAAKPPPTDDPALAYLYRMWTELEEIDRQVIIEAAEGRLARRGLPIEGLVRRKSNG